MRASLAFASETNPSAVLDALRNVDGQRTLALDAPLTRTRRARVFDHLAAALTARTSALQREEALRLPYTTSSAAGRAGLRLGAGLCARAGAGFASDGDRNFDLRGFTEEGILKRDFHIVAQVLPALSATAATATAALSGHAEQIFKDIGER